jgi:predicted ribosomally synthesized peptide with SipW-like signal peptide
MEVNIMYSKKALPVGTMFLVLVIALALLGVGYALWSETLTITGTVQTGEVDVEFSQYPAEECIDIQGVLTCPEPPEKAAAANCTVAWSNTATDPNDNGANLLEVTVTGMYPSYHCKVSFDVRARATCRSTSGCLRRPLIILNGLPQILKIATRMAFNCTRVKKTGLCTMDIHFTNDQAPPENSGPITFGWTILATQFNEDPAPPADIITVTSANLNFSATGWGGWSCSVPDHPYVVSATTNCAGSLTQYLWEPGATTGSVNYPNTPFGYTYTPPEEGSIVQMGGTAQTCNIILQCSDQP